MPSEKLENMVKADLLKKEPPDQAEFDSFVRLGRLLMQDARNEGISVEARFHLAYEATHQLSLAALRWHGYRPNKKRFVVFDALPYTVGMSGRTLRDAHDRRNRTDYEGGVMDQAMTKAVMNDCEALLAKVAGLGPCRASA